MNTRLSFSSENSVQCCIVDKRRTLCRVNKKTHTAKNQTLRKRLQTSLHMCGQSLAHADTCICLTMSLTDSLNKTARAVSLKGVRCTSTVYFSELLVKWAAFLLCCWLVTAVVKPSSRRVLIVGLMRRRTQWLRLGGYIMYTLIQQAMPTSRNASQRRCFLCGTLSRTGTQLVK